MTTTKTLWHRCARFARPRPLNSLVCAVFAIGLFLTSIRR